jgi:hypothetical protein
MYIRSVLCLILCYVALVHSADICTIPYVSTYNRRWNMIEIRETAVNCNAQGTCWNYWLSVCGFLPKCPTLTDAACQQRNTSSVETMYVLGDVASAVITEFADDYLRINYTEGHTTGCANGMRTFTLDLYCVDFVYPDYQRLIVYEPNQCYYNLKMPVNKERCTSQTPITSNNWQIFAPPTATTTTIGASTTTTTGATGGQGPSFCRSDFVSPTNRIWKFPYIHETAVACGPAACYNYWVAACGSNYYCPNPTDAACQQRNTSSNSTNYVLGDANSGVLTQYYDDWIRINYTQGHALNCANGVRNMTLDLFCVENIAIATTRLIVVENVQCVYHLRMPVDKAYCSGPTITTDNYLQFTNGYVPTTTTTTGPSNPVPGWCSKDYISSTGRSWSLVNIGEEVVACGPNTCYDYTVSACGYESRCLTVYDAACQHNNASETAPVYVLGDATTGQIVEVADDILRIVYTGGHDTGGCTTARSMHLTLYCVADISLAKTTLMVNEPNICFYNLTMPVSSRYCKGDPITNNHYKYFSEGGNYVATIGPSGEKAKSSNVAVYVLVPLLLIALGVAGVAVYFAYFKKRKGPWNLLEGLGQGEDSADEVDI